MTDTLNMNDWPYDELSLISLPFHPADKEHWSVAFWWLKSERPGLELLYGWCVARQGDDAPRWSAINCDPVRGEERAYEVERCVIDGPARMIFPFIAGLARGETLGRAASAAGLPEPPTPFLECRLVGGSGDAAAQLVRTPWMLLDTGTRASDRADHERGPVSPSTEAPCLMRSLEPLDLSTLFERDGAVDRALLGAAARRLTEETGLNFAGSWFERIGAFDLLAFPAAFSDETARVQARAHGGSAIAVSVELEGLDGFNELIVRCNQNVLGVTLSDEVQFVAVSQPGVVEVIFQGPVGGPYATQVEAWLRETATGRSRLLYAHTFYWIQQVRVRGHVIHGQASVRSDWLDVFAKAGKTRLRAQAMKTSPLVASELQMVIGDPHLAFEAVARRRRELRRRMFPPASGTRLFPVGYGAGSSRLAIAEWFGEIPADGDARILVVDPYFDTWGLELIARTKRTDVEWVVLTCLQHRRDGGEAAEARLRAGWAQLAPLLASRRVRIVELKSAHKEPAFHDRYVLTIGKDGLPQKGFQLSNSLQAGAVIHPLLVTPIGEDALEAVADYVRGLLDVPTETDVATASPPLLFKREILLSAVAVTPGIQDGPPGDADTLVARVLGAESDEAFAGDWAALCSLLANTLGDDLFNRIALDGGVALAARLEGFIGTSPRYEPPRGTFGAPASAEPISLLQLTKQPFSEVVREAATHLQHWRGFAGRPWSLLYATRLLAERDPAALVRTADRLVSEAPPPDRPFPEQSPMADVFRHLFSAAVVRLHGEAHSGTSDNPLLPSLARAATPFLRAVAGASLFDPVRAEPGKVSSISLLQDRDERLLTMAAWVYGLRLSANRAGRTESEEIARARAAIFERMKIDWRERSPDELRAVVRLLSGPSEGSWAGSTVSDLLLPLAQDGRQSREAIDRAFATMVNERIAGVANGQHFYYESDAELTDVTAGLLASSPLNEEDMSALVAVTDRVVARALRLLARPFLRSTDYTGWARAREAITWAAAYGQLILLHGGKSIAAAAAKAWIAGAQSLVQTDRDPLVIGDERNLGAFARAVEKSAREQAAHLSEGDRSEDREVPIRPE